MALLHVMAAWASNTNRQLHAVTVNHHLRPEAADEVDFVAGCCDALGVPHSVLDWTEWQGAGNLQASARDARYRLMSEWAAKLGLEQVALGHTRDDLAETFVMRLGRAAGLDGLSAMSARFESMGVTWVRPFLRESREDLRSYLTQNGLTWCEDPSNDDLQFERIQVRQTLAHLDVPSEAIARSAIALASARRALDDYTIVEARAHVFEDRGDILIPKAPSYPEEIQRRLLIAALRWVGGSNYVPRQSAVDGIDAALAMAPRHTVAGCLISVDGLNFRVSREYNAVRDLLAPAQGAWDRRWTVTGPDIASVEVGPLGEAGLRLCPNWRETGMPRRSLLASPAIWKNRTLIAAPLAGRSEGWSVEISFPFINFLDSR